SHEKPRWRPRSLAEAASSAACMRCPPSSPLRHPLPQESHQLGQLAHQGHPIPRANYLDIAPAPEAFRTADDELAAPREQIQLQPRDRGRGPRGEVTGDDARPVLRLQLPLYLLAELGVAEGLNPGGVPHVTPRIEDDHRQVVQGVFDLALPVFRRALFDRSG